MLFLLSPAKSLDYETPARLPSRGKPPFPRQTAVLIEALRQRTPQEIAELMSISPALGELNAARYRDWRPRYTGRNSKPAILAFAGDVYAGFDAATLSDDDLAWAHDHLAILSGLYGVLRPLDALQPYRLEMSTALATPRGRNLYQFWGDTIARHLVQRLAADASPVIVNLASQEYFKAADRPALEARVVDCVFEDWQKDAWRIVGIRAKRARGLIARHAVIHRIARPEGLQSFASEGYAFAAEASEPDRLVFRRRA